jgi:cardiolipin synthase
VAAKGEDRILTVPNLFSVARLLCAPLFLWLLFDRHDRLGAALLLAGLGLTDWVDGYVARHFNQVSTVGKVLDPTADRVLLAVGVIAIVVDGSVPLPIAIVTLVREALVTGAVLVLAAMGARRIDVQWAGKAGTFGLMVAFPLFLISHDRQFSLRHVADVLAWISVIPALVFSWYAAITYVPMARKALQEGRAGRVDSMVT